MDIRSRFLMIIHSLRTSLSSVVFFVSEGAALETLLTITKKGKLHNEEFVIRNVRIFIVMRFLSPSKRGHRKKLNTFKNPKSSMMDNGCLRTGILTNFVSFEM